MNDLSKTKVQLIAELNQLREKDADEHRKADSSGELDTLFYAAQEVSPDGFTILRPVRDNHGRVVDFTWVYENSAVARMNGTDPKLVIGKKLLDLFPGHAESNFLEAYKQVVETGASITFEEKYRGETIEASTWFRIVVVPTGTDIAILAQDITASRDAESKREDKQKYYLEKAQQLGQIGTWELDLLNNVLHWTDENCRIFGVSTGAIIDYEVFIERVHPDDREYVDKEWAAAIAGKPYDIEHRLLIDGNVSWVREKAELQVDENGVVVKAIGFTQDITDRKHAEESLRLSEETRRNLFESMSEGVFYQQADGTLTDVNAAALRMFGLTRDEFLNRTSMHSEWEVIQEDGVPLPGPQHPSMQVLSTGKPVYDLVVGILNPRTKDYTWVSTNGIPEFRDGETTPYQAFVTMHDLTERMHISKKLSDSEQKSRAWLANSPFCMKILDLDFNLQFMSQAGVTQLKIDDVTDYYGKPYPFYFFPKAFKRTMASSLAKVKETGKLIKISGLLCDIQGNERWYDHIIVSVRDSDGQFDYFMVISMDTTERKQAEEALKDSELRLQLSMNAAKAGSWTWNIETNEVIWDDRMQEIFGFEPGTYDGTYAAWKNTVHPDDAERADQQTRVALDNGTDYDFEYRLNLASEKGGWRTVRAQATVISNPQGKRIRMAGFCEDITQRKQSESQHAEIQDKLNRAERLESLGTLAGGVAHDLNNSLGPLVALPDLLADDLANLEEANIEEMRETVGVLQQSALRAANTVRDLVHLGRRGNCDLIPLDLNKHHCICGDCKDIETIRAANPDVSFSSNLSDECLMVSGDEDHLSRAICNIVQNAAESITDKGEVTLKTFKKSMDTADVGYETVPKGEYAVIEISDTGAGIQEDVLARMFEPFFTKKKQTEKSGSGLGLSVVHGIIKDHNAFIGVQSTVGVGSVFTIYLPLVEQTEAEGVTSTPTTVVGGTERILIIDDEHSLRFTGRKSLTGLGYMVAEAENGRQALEYFENAKRAGEESPYDLIVLDMIMESDLDGLRTYEEILEMFPKQKAIICSGFAENDRAKAAQALGADWLAKPYTLAELALAVRKRMDRET